MKQTQRLLPAFLTASIGPVESWKKEVPLLVSRVVQIDAMSQEGTGRCSSSSFETNSTDGAPKMTTTSKILGASLALAVTFLIPNEVLAHDGKLFSAEITSLESLFTGGYMRLGLLGVCGVTAIAGAIKQSGSVFITGILAGVFAYFMRDWIQATFALVI